MVPVPPKRGRRRWYKQILTPTTITIKQTHLVKENMMGIRDEWASLQHTHSIGKNNEHLFVHSLPKFPFPLPRIPFLALPINSLFFGILISNIFTFYDYFLISFLLTDIRCSFHSENTERNNGKYTYCCNKHCTAQIHFVYLWRKKTTLSINLKTYIVWKKNSYIWIYTKN